MRIKLLAATRGHSGTGREGDTLLHVDTSVDLFARTTRIVDAATLMRSMRVAT
jgi:hypothetical protein